MLLEHGGGRTFSVEGPGWLSNSSKAVGGLAGEGFGSIITGRLLLPSGCGKVGDKAREATLLWGSSSTTEGVGRIHHHSYHLMRNRNHNWSLTSPGFFGGFFFEGPPSDFRART